MKRWNLKSPAPFETWVGSRQLEAAIAASGGRVRSALSRVPWINVELPAGVDELPAAIVLVLYLGFIVLDDLFPLHRFPLIANSGHPTL